MIRHTTPSYEINCPFLSQVHDVQHLRLHACAQLGGRLESRALPRPGDAPPLAITLASGAGIDLLFPHSRRLRDLPGQPSAVLPRATRITSAPFNFFHHRRVCTARFYFPSGFLRAFAYTGGHLGSTLPFPCANRTSRWLRSCIPSSRGHNIAPFLRSLSLSFTHLAASTTRLLTVKAFRAGSVYVQPSRCSAHYHPRSPSCRAELAHLSAEQLRNRTHKRCAPRSDSQGSPPRSNKGRRLRAHFFCTATLSRRHPSSNKISLISPWLW